MTLKRARSKAQARGSALLKRYPADSRFMVSIGQDEKGCHEKNGDSGKNGEHDPKCGHPLFQIALLHLGEIKTVYKNVALHFSHTVNCHVQDTSAVFLKNMTVYRGQKELFQRSVLG